MKMRHCGRRQALLALIVATACGSAPSTVATTSATPTGTTSTSTPQATITPTPQATPTPEPSPTPAGVLDDHFGFIVQKIYANDPIPGVVGWKVRREGDPQPLYTLHTGSTGSVNVSPDGSRLAYWTANELRVLNVARTAQPHTLLTLPKAEGSLYMAWSSDGTGLVIGVNGGGGGFADAPPGFSALRVVDVAGGQPREIVRIPNTSIVPLAWDRQAHLIAAIEPTASGSHYYDTVTEDGTLKRLQIGSAIFFPRASTDAQQAFDLIHIDTPPPFGSSIGLRVWPLGSFAGGVELRSAGGEDILGAEWRPGTVEIIVMFVNRLELWTASGGRRTLALPKLPARPAKALTRAALRVRADGKAAIVDRAYESGTNGTYSDETGVAVDLASGQLEAIPYGVTSPGPGWSVRIGP